METQKARKVTVSLEPDVIGWVRRNARREHDGNVSASVADCVEVMRRREHLQNFLRMSRAPELSPDDVARLLSEIRGETRMVGDIQLIEALRRGKSS